MLLGVAINSVHIRASTRNSNSIKSNPFGCTFIPYSYHINTICFLFLGFFGKKLVTLCLQKFTHTHTHTLTFSSINKKHTHTDTHTLTFSISYWMALQYQATFNLICCSATQKLRVCIPMAIYYSVWANKYVICHINFSLLLRCKLIQIRLFASQLINHVERWSYLDTSYIKMSKRSISIQIQIAKILFFFLGWSENGQRWLGKWSLQIRNS